MAKAMLAPLKFPNSAAERESMICGLRIDVKAFEARRRGVVEASSVHDDAADTGAVPADPLRRRMQHDVRAVLDRSIEERGSEGVVYDERHSRRVRDVGNCAQIGHVEPGIGRWSRRTPPLSSRRLPPRTTTGRFHPRSAWLMPSRARVYLSNVNVPPYNDDDETIESPACARLRSASVWPPGGSNGRRSPPPALEIGDALLERVGGGVHDAGVDVSELLQSEQAGGVLRAVEDVTRGGVDGDGARAFVPGAAFSWPT